MTETEPLTREQLILWRRAIEVETLTGWPVEKVALIDTALHYEARLREVEAMLVVSEQHTEHWQDRALAAEAEQDRLQEWTDRVAQTSTDAATAAEKAEARVAELEEKANNYDKIIKIANEDSLASDGLEMIFAAMREDKEEN